MNEFDLSRARSYFIFENGTTYLNHASHGPLSIPAREAYNRFFDSWQMTAHRHDPDSFRMFETLRAQLGKFINTNPRNIGYIPHTSYGLNLASSGYPFKEGDNVILSEKEFPAIIYPWLRLRKQGVNIGFAPTSGGFINEDAIISLADSHTRIIAVSWVQFNNGHRTDLEKLGDFCRKNNILFCVDGIQGLGAVPLDISTLAVDIFSCGCQKWMLGPCGTGFVYMSAKAQSILEPPVMGWLSVDWHAEFSDLMKYDLELKKGPSRFEFGTYPFQDLIALNESVKILQSFGPQVIWNQVFSLTQQLIEYIKSSPKYKLISAYDKSRRTGIVSFRAGDSKSLFDYLSNNGYVVSYREDAVRVSPHFYNSADEIDSLIRALDNFSG